MSGFETKEDGARTVACVDGRHDLCSGYFRQNAARPSWDHRCQCQCHMESEVGE